jgi:hypothetical protein
VIVSWWLAGYIKANLGFYQLALQPLCGQTKHLQAEEYAVCLLMNAQQALA